MSRLPTSGLSHFVVARTSSACRPRHLLTQFLRSCTHLKPLCGDTTSCCRSTACRVGGRPTEAAELTFYILLHLCVCVCVLRRTIFFLLIRRLSIWVIIWLFTEPTGLIIDGSRWHSLRDNPSPPLLLSSGTLCVVCGSASRRLSDHRSASICASFVPRRNQQSVTR